MGLWGPVLGLMVVIFMQSASSDPRLPAGLSDKLAHGAIYAALAALAVRGFAGGRWSGVTGAALWLAAALATVYGISDELHQRFVPNRVAELGDVVADTVGVVAAVVAIGVWSMIRAQRSTAQGRAS